MADQRMEEVVAAVAAGVVDAQLALDQAALDSFAAFDETGVTPTVLTWRTCRLSVPVAAGVAPKAAAGERTSATIAPGSGATVTFSLRQFGSPQGGDDPHPVLP
jgi:hypothetical protein